MSAASAHSAHAAHAAHKAQAALARISVAASAEAKALLDAVLADPAAERSAQAKAHYSRAYALENTGRQKLADEALAEAARLGELRPRLGRLRQVGKEHRRVRGELLVGGELFSTSAEALEDCVDRALAEQDRAIGGLLREVDERGGRVEDEEGDRRPDGLARQVGQSRGSGTVAECAC